MSVSQDMRSPEQWQLFLLYKKKNHISKNEAARIENFIEKRSYEHYAQLIESGHFPESIPRKLIINKEGTDKKRVVYSFNDDENLVLKFIAYGLYQFDYVLTDGCYAFRRNYGVKDAMKHFHKNAAYSHKYCFKADISNYFNSIDVELLLNKLKFVEEKDETLYKLFERLLCADLVYENGQLVNESHGAMAGTPVSPFFANVYLSDMDKWFCERGTEYFRYSDDILIFADTEEEMNFYIQKFTDILREHRLSVNKSKVMLAKPCETWEFLGFSYDRGEIDLSENTMKKIKGKIKRKADALRRWQRKKGLPPEKAAKGFINAMNIKFFGTESENKSERASDFLQDEFTWARWFFPNITTDKSLKIIDAYMQEYIRYVITGRHYKGNYRITYGQLKEMGYRSLVNEYYRGRKRPLYPSSVHNDGLTCEVRMPGCKTVD